MFTLFTLYSMANSQYKLPGGLIFGGAYVGREICVSKSIKVACTGKEIYHVCLVYFVFDGKFQVQAPRGAYIWRAI